MWGGMKGVWERNACIDPPGPSLALPGAQGTQIQVFVGLLGSGGSGGLGLGLPVFPIVGY